MANSPAVALSRPAGAGIRAKRPPERLSSSFDARDALARVNNYRVDALAAYADYGRYAAGTATASRHYARYEAYTEVADAWYAVLDAWFAAQAAG